MTINSKPIFILGLALLIWNACKEKESAKEQPVVFAPQQEYSYDFPTPDSSAFQGEVECRTSHNKYKYCGYASCQSDSGLWQPKVALYRFFPETDSMIGAIEFYELKSSGSPKSKLTISNLALAPGLYFPTKDSVHRGIKDISIRYYDVNGACSHYTIYWPDSSQTSYIKVISYDSISRELKMRFNLYFKLDEALKPGYPTYLHFDDGIVFARAVK